MKSMTCVLCIFLVSILLSGSAMADLRIAPGQSLPSDSAPQAGTPSPEPRCSPLLGEGRPGEADANVWRSVVRVGSDSAFCNGILVAPDLVLTMNYCRVDDLQVSVLAGAESPVSYEVAKFIPHPERTAEDGRPLLLKLEKPVEGATPMALADRDIEAAFAVRGACALTVGQGATTEADDVAFRQVATPIVSEAECRASYGEKVDSNSICGGYESGRPDVCQGFSGAPVMVHAGLSGWRVLGLVGWGEGCGAPGKYTVSIRVAPLLDWIRDVAKADKKEL